MRWTPIALRLLARVLTRARCAICDVAFEAPLCGACAPQLPWLVAPVQSSATIRRFAAWKYQEPVASAVRRLKYADRPDLARPLLAIAAAALRGAVAEQPDLIVPVPLHPRRLAERGYNQAALLARALCVEFEVELGAAVVAPRVLCRRVDTGQLAGAGRQERRRRVVRAFGLRQSVQGRRVLLVDDVVTTGATVEACAEVLRSGGATVLGALALCRTESA